MTAPQYTLRPPLSHDQARQFLRENPRSDGTVVSVQGADGEGRGQFKDISYTIAYNDGFQLREVDQVQPVRPRWPETVMVVAASPGDPVTFIRRGQSVEYEIWSTPWIKVCESEGGEPRP